MRAVHTERHRLARSGWLRAAVLGANDGIVSTASLVIGVASASQSKSAVLIAGVAGLVAGAMSMAAGEYVSVSSQADSEKADLALERNELREQPESELRELTDIYVARGLKPDLARQVAEQLTARDALSAHARDELGISEQLRARPLQAAAASATAFASGAALPLLVALIVPLSIAAPAVGVSALACLALLGGVSARLGGARIWRPVARVAFWGALAMAASAAIGSALGVVV